MGNCSARPTVFYTILLYAILFYLLPSSFLGRNIFLEIFFRKFQFIFFLGGKKPRYTTLQNNGENCRLSSQF